MTIKIVPTSFVVMTWITENEICFQSVCMHACVHGCVHACVHACVHGCVHGCVCKCVWTSSILWVKKNELNVGMKVPALRIHSIQCWCSRGTSTYQVWTVLGSGILSLSYKVYNTVINGNNVQLQIS